MKYIFINSIIANINGNIPKICQFGYLLTDDNFNTIKEENYYINPGVGEDFSYVEKQRIRLDNFKNNYKYYHQQKMFRHFYDDIRSLLEQDMVLVVGWSTKQEVLNILRECDRYKMERFDFKCFDCQEIYDSLYGLSNQEKLEKSVAADRFVEIVDKSALANCHLIRNNLQDILNKCKWTLDDIRGYKALKSGFYNASQVYNSFAIENQYIEYRKLAAKELEWDNIKRLVFFDFESANEYDGIGKICEVGVVITDINLNIVRTRHFPINPRSKFNLVGRNGRGDLHLFWEADDYKIYREANDFNDMYSDLIDIFNLPNSLCVGYSVESDISFLATDTQRNRRKQIIFTAIDVQYFANKILNQDRKSNVALGKTFDALVDQTFQEKLVAHKSVDDARMTLEVLRKVLERENKTIKELVNENNECIYSSKFFIETFNAKIRHCNKLNLIKKPVSKTLELYKNVCQEDKKKAEDPNYSKKRYGISSYTQKIDENEMAQLIDAIHNLGGIILGGSTHDVMVVLNEEDCLRLKRISEKLKLIKFVYLADIIGKEDKLV